MNMCSDKSQTEFNPENLRKCQFSLRNRLARQIWSLVAITLFRTSPRFLHYWRRLLLRFFGAKVGKRVRIQPSVRIWAPWNLELGAYCSIGAYVDCYSVGKIRIGDYVTVSQRTFLCTASHDYKYLDTPQIHSDITIDKFSWICAEVLVMPNVTIGEGAVIGARSLVLRSVPKWVVAAGNPCKVVHPRSISSDVIWRKRRSDETGPAPS